MSELAWGWVAFVAALIGTAASLGLSVVLKLRACPLCFYQRSAVMGVVAVLLVGLLAAPDQAALLCLVCWPIHVTGLGVALFHVRLVQLRVLECPRGFRGLGTVPHQSLIFFLLAAVPLMLGARAGFDFAGLGSLGGATVATLIGLVMAVLGVISSPPPPAVPTRAYDPVSQPLDICRPPFRGGNRQPTAAGVSP